MLEFCNFDIQRKIIEFFTGKKLGMFFFSKMMKIVLLDRYFFASLNEILSGFLQLFRGDVNSFQSFLKSDFAIQSDTEIIKKNRQFAMLCILNKSFDLT